MIYISLDNFYIKVHEAIKPVLRQVPFALVEQNQIIAVNAIAQSRGIRIGTSYENAKKQILNLTIEHRRDKLIKSFSKEFFSLLAKSDFTIEPDSLWGAYIHSSFFDLKQTNIKVEIECLKKQISHELEMSVKIGVSSNKIAAKLASYIASPNETVCVEKGKELDFLKSLPISLLPGIGKRTGSLLAGFGITTIGAFSELPIKDIVRLFGKSGLALHNTANGLTEIKTDQKNLGKTISKSYQLPFPSRNLPHILTLSSFLLYQLQSHQDKTVELPKVCIVTMYTNKNNKISKQKTIHNALDRNIIKEVNFLTKQVFNQMIGHPITKLSISLRSISSLRQNQSSKEVASAYYSSEVSKEINTKQRGFTFPFFSYGGSAQGIA